jgi:hypothetical protein
VSSPAWVWELGRERGGSVFIQTQDWVFNVLPLDKESGCNFQRAKVVCTGIEPNMRLECVLYL